jgi:hypothetical protein
VEHNAGQDQAKVDNERDLPVLGDQQANALYVLGDPLCEKQETAEQNQEWPEHSDSLSRQYLSRAGVLSRAGDLEHL